METWNKLTKPRKAWARKICYCRVRSKICSQTSPDWIRHGWWWKESILDSLPGTGSREEDQQMTDDPACWASHFGFIRWINKEVRVCGTQFLQNCLPLPILAIHNQYCWGAPKNRIKMGVPTERLVLVLTLLKKTSKCLNHEKKIIQDCFISYFVISRYLLETDAWWELAPSEW